MTGRVWPFLPAVHVTDRDIADGAPEDCLHCAVALASRRALGIPESSPMIVEATGNRIAVYADEGAWMRDAPLATWSTPRSVLRFMMLLDEECPVKPFTFAAVRVS